MNKFTDDQPINERRKIEPEPIKLVRFMGAGDYVRNGKRYIVLELGYSTGERIVVAMEPFCAAAVHESFSDLLRSDPELN